MATVTDTSPKMKSQMNIHLSPSLNRAPAPSSDSTPRRIIRKLDAIPYSLIALIARAATFSAFFRSGALKLSDWNSTLMLFRNEYHVPLLPPAIAAYLAAGLELGASTLVLVGLLTRASVAALLSMTAVIEIFVYPMAWPDHIQWLAFMFILLARGPGKLSIDVLLFGD
jgi:putative oxidoreductase